MPFIPSSSLMSEPSIRIEDTQLLEIQNAKNAVIEWAMEHPIGEPPEYLLGQVGGFLSADDIIFATDVGRTLILKGAEYE